MALVSHDQTGALTQLSAVTRPNLLKRILRETGWGQSGTCTSNGTTTTVIDTANLQSTQFNDRQWVGAFLYFSSGSGDGHIASVTAYAPSTGTLTFSPAIAASGTNSAVVYHLFRTPFPPRVLLDMIDATLQQDWWAGCQTFLSEVADYDMEQSGTSAFGTSLAASSAKTDWSLANHEGIFGNRALSVTTSSANGAIPLAAPLRVAPNHQYYAGVMHTPTDPTAAHTGVFTIYDGSNNAVLHTITTTSKVPVHMGREFTTPSNCHLIYLNFGAVQSGVVGVFDEIVFFDVTAHDAPLPWWVRNVDAIKGIYKWDHRQVGDEEHVYAPGWVGTKLQEFDYGVTAIGNGQFRLNSKSMRVGGPLFIEGIRNETAYASNTEAKRVNENWLVAQVCARLYEALVGAASKADTGPLIERKNTWQGMANREKENAAYRVQRHKPARTQWRRI